MTRRLHDRFVDQGERRPNSVRSIVVDWLRTHEYWGLYSPDDDCGCPIRDLMPCAGCSDDDSLLACKPGREYVCSCGDHWCGPPDSETTDCPVCREDDDGDQI